MNNLQKLLRIDKQELQTAFERASIEGEGTSQEVSDRREEAVHEFFRRYFPFPYRVAKGNISDSFGRRSQSIDCLILNPSHPHTVNRERYSFIVCEAVDYAIELKPSLNSEAEIHRALRQVQSVKKLKRASNGLLMTAQLNEAQKELANRVPTFIFANKSYSDKRTLIEKISSYYQTHGTPIDEQFDLIFCLDGTFVLNSSSSHALHFNVGTEGLVFCDLGVDVLYYLFHFIDAIPQSTPTLKANTLKPYLSSPPLKGWQTYHDLNGKIRASQLPS